MRTKTAQSATVSSVTDGELLTKQEVASILKCSLKQVENLVKAGRICKPTYLGTNSPRWKRSELMASL